MSESWDEGVWHELDADERVRISDALSRAGQLLEQLSRNARDGNVPGPSALSAALALVLGARSQIYGDRRPHLQGSARERILIFFQQNEGSPVSADELQEVSGIRAWERRIRELREQGHDIEYLGEGRYRLTPGR